MFFIKLMVILLFLFSITKCDFVVKVNPNKNWGIWEGWGTSLAWWANVFGDRDDLADILYTLKYTNYENVSLPGLGFNLVRYNVGGCSWNQINTSQMAASPRIPRYKQIEGFWLDWNSTDPNSNSWNWTADQKQRQMVVKAIDRGADQIELWSDTPMWWMLYNHNPSGADNGGENLQSWNYQQFAIYLATVAKYAADNWNIKFASVEPFNEASSWWWNSNGTQEGCHIGSKTQQIVIKYLREELDRRGLNKTIISASDENTYDGAVQMWNSFPGDVRSMVGRINVHGYQYASGKRDQLYQLAQNSGKPLWNSEYGEGDGTGLSLAQNLNLDLFWLHPTAWIYWQAFDGLHWGLIKSTPEKAELGELRQKYFVLAQYSRHIRKGMLILESNHSSSVFAYDQSSHRLVIVGFNKESAQNIVYDLSKFSRIESKSIKRWNTDIGTGDQYVQLNDLSVESKTLSIPFKEKSVQTIEINNVFQ